MANTVKILVVEDEAVVSMHVISRLKSMGYEVPGGAATSEEALRLAEAHHPQLVLMDIRIRGKVDGIDTAVELRRRWQIPVIFVTAYAEDGTLERAKQAEPLGYILKPFEDRELKTVIEIALHKHRSEQELRRAHRLFAVLSQVNQAIVRERHQPELFRKICEIAVENGHCALCWICRLDESTGRMVPIASNGRSPEDLENLAFYTEKIPDFTYPSSVCYRSGETCCVRGADPVEDLCRLGSLLRARGYHSCASLPLRRQEEVHGIMILVARAPDFFQEREQSLLEEVALDVSYALDQMDKEAYRQRLESAWRESEERYRRLVESSKDSILVHREGRILFANTAAAELAGASCSMELKGRSLLEFVPEEARERIAAIIFRATTGVFTPLQEQRIQRLDGAIREVEVASSPMVYEGQAAFLVVIRDLTERRQIETALRESEARFRTVFENAPAAVAVFRQGKIIYANPKVLELWGYQDPSEIVGHSVLKLVSPEVRDEIAEMARRREAGQPVAWEYDSVGMRRDGSRFYFHNAVARSEFEGSPAFFSIVTDITARKQAEERIQEQAALLDIAHDAIAVFDMDNRVQFWNPAAERVFGWKASEMIGQTRFAQLAYRDCLEQVKEARKQVLAEGSWIGELPLRDKNDRKVLVRSSRTLVRDKQGEPKAVLVVNTDLTEQKQVEAQLMRAQRIESVGRLASGVAHDLNNILAPILMLTDLLRPKLKEAEDRATLELMKTNSQRGADIVRQLLIYSRGDAEQMVELDLRRQVREIIKMARETFPKSIQFEAHLPADVPLVKGDPTQIHQVLLNLVVNARDAMPMGGSIAIGLEGMILEEDLAQRYPGAKPGPYVVLKVVDTGSGIAPDIIDKIFDPFFTTKTAEKGTGLGLSTVMGIAKGHHGFVQVQSQLGRGTEFLVYLPSCNGASTQEEDGGSVPEVSGSGELLLFIDDEEVLRLQTRRWLESKGYKVLVAADGLEALGLYTRRQQEVQAVFVDLWMPYMDGLSTIRQLRKISADVPIIAMSGLPQFEEELQRSNAPVQAFLPKPWSPQQLSRVLRGVLESNGRGRS